LSLKASGFEDLQGPAHGLGQSQEQIQAGGWRGWEQPWGERLRGAGFL